MRNTIVVIDDEDLQRSLMKKLLNSKLPHMKVVTAGDIQEGLDKIAKVNSNLALIISDFQIGSEFGSDLFINLDENPDHTSEAPRIIMSGHSEEVGRQIKNGVMGRYDLWIVKSTDVDEILNHIAQLLNE
jgi:DNA-binding NtrC family response regulator